jgi:hypothetical protein
MRRIIRPLVRLFVQFENRILNRYSGLASGNILRNSPTGKGAMPSPLFFSSFFSVWTAAGVDCASEGAVAA